MTNCFHDGGCRCDTQSCWPWREADHKRCLCGLWTRDDCFFTQRLLHLVSYRSWAKRSEIIQLTAFAGQFQSFGSHNCLLWLAKYYSDAACVLRATSLEARAPYVSSKIPWCLPWRGEFCLKDRISIQDNGSFETFGQSEELSCSIAILR